MKKLFKYLAGLILIIALICLGSIWMSYSYLETTHFEYTSPKLEEEITAVILSDLHDHEFDKDNNKLVSKVAVEKPDIIFVLGDMLNSNSEDSHIAAETTKKLAEIAPVYYALGNHEIMYMENKGRHLLSELENAGAVILELSSQDIIINGQTIRVGGMFDYAFALDGEDSTKAENMVPEVYEFLTEFQDSEKFKLMLSHRPDAFVLGEASITWEIDLVISGHCHGGQVILPFLGGLFGGDLGWFSKYVYGLHSLEKYDILVTRGLSSNAKILPRINNCPEIMVLTMRKE